MKTDYRNWMPKGMVMGSGCSAAILLILTVIFKFEKIIEGMKCHTIKEIETALKNSGFTKVSSHHHESKPWITVLARK